MNANITDIDTAGQAELEQPGVDISEINLDELPFQFILPNRAQRRAALRAERRERGQAIAFLNEMMPALRARAARQIKDATPRQMRRALADAEQAVLRLAPLSGQEVAEALPSETPLTRYLWHTTIMRRLQQEQQEGR